MKTLMSRRFVAFYWFLVGIMLTSVEVAYAQGAAAPVTSGHHRWRYIIGAVIIVLIIIYLAIRKKGPAGPPAPPTDSAPPADPAP